MNIGVELRQIKMGSSGGVSFHIKGLLEELIRRYPNDRFILFCTIFNRSLLDCASPNVLYVSLPAVHFFPEMEKLIQEYDIEILFRSFPFSDNMSFPLARQVFLIPDIQHEEFPHFFSPKALQERQKAFDRAMFGAGAIGTNTQFTKQSILAHKNNQCQDVFLSPPALSGVFMEQSKTELLPEEKRLLPKSEFFYYPANLWPHKNHRRIFLAFERFLRETGLNFELVLSGHPDGWDELRAEHPNLPVQHFGFVRTEMVRFLQERATALAFFSLYEGFGIPLLEAFQSGTPVICSNTTCLPEVGGDAVLTCDPFDIQAMSELMEKIAKDESLRSEMVKKGKQRLGSFSWEKSARNLKAAFRRVAKRYAASQPNLNLEGPLVTIVTPSFNQGRFLRRTIDSVLNQTYPNIEYIVIDGGSTDDSVEILKSYEDRLSWVSEPDHGQTDAINKGFNRSSGEILAYLNSDDVLLPDAVEKIVGFFLTHPETDLVYGRAYYIDEKDNITGMYNTDEFSIQRLAMDNCICQPATFWRKQIAQTVGLFDVKLNFVMDYDYWLRVYKSGGKIVHINDILASSRLYQETKTMTAREKIYAEIFKTSIKHLGRVHINYFLGLWYHRIWETGTGFYRLLRLLPRSQKNFAVLHYWFLNRGTYRKLISPKRLKHEIMHWLISNLGFLRPIVRKVRSRRFLVGPNNPVFGMWLDNWLGPIAQVYLKQKAPGQIFYLTGIPADDMKVKVKIDHEISEVIPLRKGQTKRIVVNASPGQKILFEFTNSIMDSSGRYLALKVTDTNLFSEQDMVLYSIP